MPSFAVAGPSVPIGLTAARERVDSSIGSRDIQPTPNPQDQVGLTAKDEAVKDVSQKFSLGNLLPAAISALGFQKPQIKRTEPFVWIMDDTGIKFRAAFVGLINKLSPILGRVDPIQTKSVLRDLATTGRGLAGRYDGMDGITQPVSDIGQRMIPDSLQSFDQFAGGFNRDVSHQTGITKVLDWMKGLNPKTTQDLVAQQSMYVKNMKIWAQDYGEYLSPTINPDILGQGWNAFAERIPVKIGTSVPVVRKTGLW